MRTAEADARVQAGEPPIVLLTLEMPSGQVLRMATAALSIDAAAYGGGPYQYQPLLTAVDDFVEEIDVFDLDGVGALTQARVEFVTPDDLAGLHAAWGHLTAATVEIATIWRGQKWRDRVILLGGGTVQSLDLGTAGQVSSFVVEVVGPASSASVGDDTRDVGAEFPGPYTTVGGADVPSLEGRGAIYVFGTPLSVPAYKLGDASALTPAGTAAENRAILCGHLLPDVSPISVYQDGVYAGALIAPENRAAAAPIGAYAYLDIDVATTLAAWPPAGDTTGAITWKASYGGIARADNTLKACTNASHVLRKLLTMSGLRVDWRRCRRCLDLLASWPIGFWFDVEVLAIDAIRQYLVPYLPIIEMQSADGLYFAYADPQIQQVDGDLVLGQNLLGRLGGVTFSDLDEVRNSFTINYLRDEYLDAYTAALTVNADNDALCALSQQLLRNDKRGDTGLRAEDPIDCPVFWEATTARRALLSIAGRRALPRRILSYVTTPDAYWVDAGSVYRLTDPEIGVNGVRGIVSSINRTLSPPEITIELLDRTPIDR